MASNGDSRESRRGQDLQAARRRLVEASRRLLIAQIAIAGRGVPVGVPEDGPVPPWDRADVAAVLEIHAAWGELVDARRTYDQLTRSARR